MKILAIEREVPGAGTVNDASLLKAEAKVIWELQASGILREIYFRADRREAVLMLECPNVGEAQAVLSTLPLARSGRIGFEVIPLSAYTGYTRLFAEGLQVSNDKTA